MTSTIERIDRTTTGDHLDVVEILTPGGVVRVNTGLVNVHTNQPAVCVEIEPNTSSRVLTGPGGDWAVTVRDRVTRTDVTLTRER